ncbi:hypothetical protein AZZ62_004054, partial [Klebsiella variicola]
DQHFIGGRFTAGGDDVAEIERRFAAADISLARRRRGIFVGDNADAEITGLDNQRVGGGKLIPA